MNIVELNSKEVVNVGGGISREDIAQSVGVVVGVTVGTALVLRNFVANARLASVIPLGVNGSQGVLNSRVVIRGANTMEYFGYFLTVSGCAYIGAVVGDAIWGK